MQGRIVPANCQNCSFELRLRRNFVVVLKARFDVDWSKDTFGKLQTEKRLDSTGKFIVVLVLCSIYR